jgi:hypothetical protein
MCLYDGVPAFGYMDQAHRMDGYRLCDILRL